MTDPNSANPPGRPNPHLDLLKAILFPENKPIMILSWEDWKAAPKRPNLDGRLLSKREVRKWFSEWIENFLQIEAYEICAEIHKTKI